MLPGAMKVTLPDGSPLDLPDGATGLDVDEVVELLALLHLPAEEEVHIIGRYLIIEWRGYLLPGSARRNEMRGHDDHQIRLRLLK